MFWNGSMLVPGGAMKFPNGFDGRCGGGSKDIAAVGTNVTLRIAGVGTFLSTNSGLDWADLELPPGMSSPGHLGMTMAPGTKGRRNGGGIWDRDLEKDTF